MDDPRPLLHRALAQVGELAAAADPDDLATPTPCAGWTVRDLLGHLVTVHRRIAHVAAGGDPLDLLHLAEIPDGDHVAALADGRERIETTWSDDAVLERLMTVPWGTMPGRVVGWGYVQELTVHAWDLAVPLGRGDDLDPVLAEAVEPVARRVLPAEPRGGHVPFGPTVDVPADADPYRRLVGWLGRTVEE